MRDYFQTQLKELNRELTIMGAACEEIIAMASESLTMYNAELGRKVSIVGAQIAASATGGD